MNRHATLRSCQQLSISALNRATSHLTNSHIGHQGHRINNEGTLIRRQLSVNLYMRTTTTQSLISNHSPTYRLLRLTQFNTSPRRLYRLISGYANATYTQTIRTRINGLSISLVINTRRSRLNILTTRLSNTTHLQVRPTSHRHINSRLLGMQNTRHNHSVTHAQTNRHGTR